MQLQFQAFDHASSCNPPLSLHPRRQSQRPYQLGGGGLRRGADSNDDEAGAADNDKADGDEVVFYAYRACVGSRLDFGWWKSCVGLGFMFYLARRRLVTMSEIDVPVGYIFMPSDEQLVGHYLYRKITGRLSMLDQLIVKECDLYGEEEPWEIWEKFGGGEGDLFLFTKLKRKSSAGSNFIRKVGPDGGTWHGETRGVDIQVPGMMGSAKRLSYRNPNSPQNGRWLMKQYSLTIDHPDGDYVLCRIRRKTDEVPSTGHGTSKRKKGCGDKIVEKMSSKKRRVEQVSSAESIAVKPANSAIDEEYSRGSEETESESNGEAHVKAVGAKAPVLSKTVTVQVIPPEMQEITSRPNDADTTLGPKVSLRKKQSEMQEIALRRSDAEAMPGFKVSHRENPLELQEVTSMSDAEAILAPKLSQDIVPYRVTVSPSRWLTTEDVVPYRREKVAQRIPLEIQEITSRSNDEEAILAAKILQDIVPRQVRVSSSTSTVSSKKGAVPDRHEKVVQENPSEMQEITSGNNEEAILAAKVLHDGVPHRVRVSPSTSIISTEKDVVPADTHRKVKTDAKASCTTPGFDIKPVDTHFDVSSESSIIEFCIDLQNSIAKNKGHKC
ncbi:hypothetical protein Tsubulata_019106 [Turnera subulata]|uniref:NAC domain-containing protein n=1 Tax=Turnera subulata TaxID=218843 RepID=A0A9Q0FHT7_9ROSI|nr:hypothetical protein Tsubulata_019106 [Turnera subulata]